MVKARDGRSVDAVDQRSRLGGFQNTLSDLVLVTPRHLKKGARLRLTGLGILRVRHRAARMGCNPATGEPIKIKASKKIAFRPAKELKDTV